MFTREELTARLQQSPRRDDRSDDGTARLLGGTAPMSRDLSRPLTPAAVLVPLVERPDGLQVLLTQRTAHLEHHPGQISFPGGRMEAEDASPEAAALRESLEEIGLQAEHITPIGRLDDYVTVTGFRVIPVVGWITPPFTLELDPFEVADAFEVPLAFLLDHRNRQRHFRTGADGQRRYYYAIPWQDRYIWGATAGMLVNLAEWLEERPAPDTP